MNGRIRAQEPAPRLRGGAPIDVRSVTKAFGAVPVLKEISLSIRAGEFVTILGPSGSGKSTLLNIIAGFEHPNGGEILVGGTDLVPVPPHKRGFGMVFQNYALFPNMDVVKNVAFPLRIAGVAESEIDRRVADVLHLLGLSEHIHKRPSELSGGQQQRVAIARAIVADPAVILMDEPLSALDKKLRENIQLELKSLHSKIGSTFLFVTHDQSEALTMSDRIAVMDDGLIAQFATPDEIYRQPASEFVARFIGESNLIPVSVKGSANGRLSVMSRYGTLHQSRQHLEAAEGEDILLMVRPENVDLLPNGDPRGIAVRVVSVVFMGEILRVEVRTECGDTILVRAISGRLSSPPVPGAAARISWDDENGWLVK